MTNELKDAHTRQSSPESRHKLPTARQQDNKRNKHPILYLCLHLTPSTPSPPPPPSTCPARACHPWALQSSSLTPAWRAVRPQLLTVRQTPPEKRSARKTTLVAPLIWRAAAAAPHSSTLFMSPHRTLSFGIKKKKKKKRKDRKKNPSKKRGEEEKHKGYGRWRGGWAEEKEGEGEKKKKKKNLPVFSCAKTSTSSDNGSGGFSWPRHSSEASPS